MHLLIVEDDPDLAALIEAIGVGRGHDVQRVATAEQTFEAVAARRPDAIVLDIQLDGVLDGRDVLSRIADRTIPVFVYTSSHDELTLKLCWAYGARDVFQKGMPATALLVRIERTLEADRHHGG